MAKALTGLLLFGSDLCLARCAYKRIHCKKAALRKGTDHSPQDATPVAN